MPPKLGARKNGKFRAVSTAPSFNKTPMGSSTPPVPYPVYQDLSTSVGTATTVKFNSDEAYVLNQSSQPTCIGDSPGVALGVKSGTVSGEVKPVQGSSTVNVCGNPIIREGDPCTMQGANCPGIFVTVTPPAGTICDGAPAPESPPVEPETPNERDAAREKRGFWGALWDKTKFEMGEAVDHPWEGVKGATKGILNIPSNLLEMMAKGSALNAAGELEQAGAMQALFGREEDSAKSFELAQATRAGADEIKVPKFEMSNPAQSGGDTIATVVQLLAAGAGLAKASVKGLASVGKAEGTLVAAEQALVGTAVAEDSAAIQKAIVASKGGVETAVGTDGVRLTGSVASKSAPRLGSLKSVGQGTWESSGGLRYVGSDAKGLNRVQHVLRHATADPSKKVHSVFNVPRNRVLALVDEAWVSRGGSVPGDPGAFVVSMGRTVGTAGEDAVKIIVRPGTNEIISAYPVRVP